LLAIEVLPSEARELLRANLEPHMDPKELDPQEAFAILWGAGYAHNAARAWETVKALAYAEICAKALVARERV
jgi:hypothetical protein